MVVETSKSANIIKAPRGIEPRHPILFMNRTHTLQICGARILKLTGSGVNQLDSFYAEQLRPGMVIMISMQTRVS